MDRSKVVAVITGAIAILLSIAYLLIVQLLDWRGEMIPAPVDLSALPFANSSWVERILSCTVWLGGRLL
ncbi:MULTISPECIES: hypothetical protein [Cyanophyceae]|uniref:hypothetical protein n=1 Tax=Cyanophyceae TaxID=3028117 RepID=UPI00074D3B56|nr:MULTISPECIES: hypothetical protein [Cyanophyceae]MBF2083518.1 hypothetical protein [Thermoleptolyngbya sp. C42_A2020_037]BAU42070.1 hypothetical protein O77CONTIG1_01888 [Leptolyngbya sp. O-77]